MTEIQKIQLFTEMIKCEALSEQKTYDGVNYFDKGQGIYTALKILNLDKEYIEWSKNKDMSRF